MQTRKSVGQGPSDLRFRRGRATSAQRQEPVGRTRRRGQEVSVDQTCCAPMMNHRQREPGAANGKHLDAGPLRPQQGACRLEVGVLEAIEYDRLGTKAEQFIEFLSRAPAA